MFPKVVGGGTVEGLLNYLISSYNYESEYLNHFLLSYRSMMNAEKLIEGIEERVKKNLDDQALLGRVVAVIFVWLKMRKSSFDEFSSYELIQKMNQLISILPRSKDLKQQLTKDIEPYPKPPPIPEKNDISSLLNDLKVDTIAEHVTLIDHYFLASISISEFENQNWTKTNEENNAAPNLSNISKRFNLFSSFVVYYIISSDNLKEKSLRYSKFVSVLEKLMSLNNFFSSRSVYAALKSVPIVVKYSLY